MSPGETVLLWCGLIVFGCVVLISLYWYLDYKHDRKMVRQAGRPQHPSHSHVIQDSGGESVTVLHGLYDWKKDGDL